MKVVINACFGGFSLSPRAVQRMAELQGRPCFFYRNVRVAGDLNFRRYERITLEQASDRATFTWFAFDVPDAETSVLGLYTDEEWHGATDEQKRLWGAVYDAHDLEKRPESRHDPLLVAVVEELGEAANGSHADLRVVEIPDGVEYEVSEYDGLEHIAETHRTWR